MILAGRFDIGLLDVSAVDTGLWAWLTPPGRGGGPGTLIPPLGVPIPEPAPFPASHPFWFSRRHPEVVVRRRVRPTSALSRPIARGRGSTGRGLCVLHEGPTYLEYPRPSSSRSPPSCSARWRHQITASNGNQDRPTRRTSGLGSKGAPQGAAAGGILRVRGHFCAAGDVPRVGGRDCCPRRRRTPPPGTTRTRPRGMSPSWVMVSWMRVSRG